MDSFGLASILLVSLVFIASLSNGAISEGDGCPDDYELGDTWYQDECMQCLCTNSSTRPKFHSCFSCGLVWGDPKKCYTVRNDTATYPDCCDTLVCKGDDDFDEALIIGS